MTEDDRLLVALATSISQEGWIGIELNHQWALGRLEAFYGPLEELARALRLAAKDRSFPGIIKIDYEGILG